MNNLVPNTLNFQTFEEAGKQVLNFLHQQYGFGLWMITRVEGDDWIVLEAENQKYSVQKGQVFRWSDSFCFHMVQGKAPKVAVDADEIPQYQAANIRQHFLIKSYIGHALLNEDGSLFGTLCAIDTEPKHPDMLGVQALIELLGGLLSTILQAELRENQQRRLKERFEVEALTDALTGLFNRRAWNQLMQAEELRCQMYGLNATVLSIDLNDLKLINDQYGHDQGDHLIQKTATLLKENVHSNDVVARMGGDEFTILCPETGTEEADLLFKRLETLFEQHQIQIAMGYAVRQHHASLEIALKEADQKMYVQKRQKKVAG